MFGRLGAGRVSGLSLVSNLEQELDVLALVGEEMRVEDFHWDTAEDVSDSWHRVGESAQVGR